MQKYFKIVLCLCLLVGAVLIQSCKNGFDEYYELPDWLKGNAYELLQSKGNYTKFLEAVDLAGYKDMISGKGIITVMAPSDEAFDRYLSEKGYASVGDIPLAELQKLVGFHLVYYAFDKEKFANYRPEGVTDRVEYTDAGLYYKFRTKSSDPIEEVVDNTVAPNSSEKRVKVYHKERFLPVLSSYIFETKGIDAAYNYQYFYPNTKWDGNDGGFCVSNANVEEYALVTDNGYVYTINQVLEPLETVHNELEKSGFSLFKQLYDKFESFEYDADLTADYGGGDTLYLYAHTDLPMIASEWTKNGTNDYADLATLAKVAYNVFAPTDASLQNFFDSFWKGYYNSITDVAFLPVKYLLDNHVYQGDIIFPEEIANGKISTIFDNVVDFDVNNTSSAKLCVNGVLYGLNELMVPPMYSSVTAPLFQDPDLLMFLQMIDELDMMMSLASTAVDFTLFMPSTKAIVDNTTLSGLSLLFQNTNINKYGSQSILIETDEGYQNMSNSVKTDFVNNHICSKLMTTVGNKKIFKTRNSFQYILVEDDKYAYSSDIYNNYKSTPSVITSITTHDNGMSYKVDGESTRALYYDVSDFKDQITKNTPEGFEKFKELVEFAQWHTETPSFSFLQGKRFIVLVPTNEAIEEIAGDLPTTVEEMREYLKRYFIDVTASSLEDYPFPGAGLQGNFKTFQSATESTATLRFVDKGSNLQVIDEMSNTVNILEVFPRIYNDGAAYVIEATLE